MGLVGTAGGQSWQGRAAGLATADAGMSCQHDHEASQSNHQQHLPSIRDSATPVCSRGTDTEPEGGVSASPPPCSHSLQSQTRQLWKMTQGASKAQCGVHCAAPPLCCPCDRATPPSWVAKLPHKHAEHQGCWTGATRPSCSVAGRVLESMEGTDAMVDVILRADITVDYKVVTHVTTTKYSRLPQHPPSLLPRLEKRPRG